MKRQKTNIYVDGFNLYYGALRKTRYRWLNIALLCQKILPASETNRIRYFTARVTNRSNDPSQPQRQALYLRALLTIPNLTIHYGTFLDSVVRMPLVTPIPNGPRTVEVRKTEEKGSDVNIASYLLLDAFDGDFEQAVVVSNDSDLALPIRMVRDRLQFPIGVLCPYPRVNKQLNWAATFVRHIRAGPLGASQFAATLSDANGTFSKPSSW